MIHRKRVSHQIHRRTIAMRNDIRNDLKLARKEYDSQNYSESLEIYENVFSQFPEVFNLGDLISYCWAIYRVHVKQFSDESELFEATETICDLIPQADLNNVKTCPYTFSVFRVLDYLYKQHEYYNISYWADKLNHDLLDVKRGNFKGRFSRSRKEKYYDYLSKSHLECAEWEDCIEISTEALQTLNVFTNNGDVWHHWRIAKSLKELNQVEDALAHLEEVIKVKNDWFVYKEFIEDYYLLGNIDKALEYVCDAVLTDDPDKLKVNLYYLVYKLLNESNPDIAFKHAEAYYMIKLESNSEIAQDIEELYIDEDVLDKDDLINEIKSYWEDFKYQNQELQYGTVTKYFDDKNFGFITDGNDESIFFHKKEFRGDNVHVGQLVSFYTEMSFDKSKNKESMKAVNVIGE